MDLTVKQPAVPRYQRIKAHLLESIHQGQYQPGTKIPPELELARIFEVSRMTVNKAIHELVEDGVLLRFAGDGTYVAEIKAEAPLMEVSNIAAEIEQRQHAHASRVVAHRALEADEALAKRMDMAIGDTVYYSLIVHSEDDLPVQLEERYVNPNWAPGYLEQDFSRTTPNAFLMSNSPLTAVEHRVRAVLPERRERELLQVDADEPCLLVLRQSWAHRCLVAYARLLHPGSRYTLHSHLKM
nr:histidine utilization repressor [Crenobacter caeni]